MNQHLHSPNKLTEFARDFENEPDSVFGRWVNKLQSTYNQSYNTVNDAPNSSATQVNKSTFYTNAENRADSSSSQRHVQTEKSTTTTATVAKPANAQSDDAASTTSTTTTTASNSGATSESGEKVEDEANEERSMISVLKRLKNIVAASKNDNDLRNYKDTDLRRFWMPDSKAKECYDCSQKFSTFRRKHHCRLCGQIFCSKCCNQVVPGKIFNCAGDLKVCNYCSKIVLSYLNSLDIAVDLQADLQALQQDLSSKLEDKDDSANTGSMPIHVNQTRLATNEGYQEERFATHQPSMSLDDRKNILQQSNSLITLHEEMQHALPTQCCGTDLIEYLNSNHKSSSKVQAVAILSALLAAGFLQPIVPDPEQTEFDETLHYKLVDLPRRQALESIGYWNVSRQSADYGTGESCVFASSNEPQRPKAIDTSASFQSMQDIEVESSIRFTVTTSKLLESYCDHEEQLLSQMLRTFQLDTHWAKILTPLCCRAANNFKPEYCTNELIDVRNYVNFKKVPGGKRSECTIVGGVVFSKNVAHKDMATRVEMPRILLLQCPIVYERVEGKFVSMSTVLLQEKEYLRHVCARIMSFQPNVVLVHKNVAGLAQDMLRAEGITLVLDVKLSVMERLARTLQCDMLTSVESNIAKPRLGSCDAFYIRSFGDGTGGYKTLMFFEKLTNPRGYTCLLRGGSNAELIRVKHVASFLVYARYNWRLEMSFLLDEFAQPLEPKPPIFDSKESSPKDENSNQSELDGHANTKESQLRSPAARGLLERKSEDKIQAAVTENVDDYTDPLRSAEPPASNAALSPDSGGVLSLAVEMRYDNRFRNALSSTLLSVSPFVTFPLPYLETEQGRKCKLRALFPTELYFSKLWSSASSATISSTGSPFSNALDRQTSQEGTCTQTIEEVHQKQLLEQKLNPPHPFLKLKIAEPIDNRDIQTLLAEFRAYGGRYPKRKKMFKLSKQRKQSYQQPQKISEDQVYKDALDVENHQRLTVLFCSFYFNPKAASSFCAPPTLFDMKFYGKHDIRLGQFLQQYCCCLNTICSLCNLPKLSHVRRYVHQLGCVQVFLTEDRTNDPDRIYFTAWCSLCNVVTPTVPLSDHAKCLSFAKYLELRFHGHSYKKRPLEVSTALKSGTGVAPDDGTNLPPSTCQHSLHRDYIHYFTYKGVGAKFQYTSVEIWEIGLPPLPLQLQALSACNHFQVLEEVKNFSLKGHEVYTRIHERIADLAMEDEHSPLVGSLKTTLSKDQFLFKQHIEIVQTLLTMSKASAYDINDALLMAKRVLAESIELWGPRMNSISAAQKQAAKQQQQTMPTTDSGTICTEDYVATSSAPDTPQLTAGDSTSLADEEEGLAELTPTAKGQHQANAGEKKEQQMNTPTTTSTSTTGSGSAISEKKSIKKMLIHLLPSTEPVNLLQSPFAANEHHTLPLGAFPMVVRDQDMSSIIAYSLTSPDYQRLTAGLGKGESNDASQPPSASASAATNPSPNFKRKSQETSHDSSDDNAATPNINQNNNNNNSAADEERHKSKASSSHIELSLQREAGTQLTCKIYFAREFDVMRAKTLKPPKLNKSLYKELEQTKRREELKVSQTRTGAEMELVRKASDAEVLTTGINNSATPTTGNNNNNNNNTKSNSNEEENVQQQQSELEAESRQYLARSLSSSVQWEARGGKSGSRFCKTTDDRFVLKAMSKGDINFFEQFAPNYFEYIGKCQQHNYPTFLTKIFGVFKVSIKKKDSFQECSLLVMENLFYDCEINNKFDLKGSERNRLVDPANQNGEIVLLDENFVQMSWSKPLYVLSHSKAVLKDAIQRDATFLEKNHVMDYSLLVGLNKQNGLLILGIIDYIRAYTFDKKVESIVKQTGSLLGGTTKLPTVIAPELYKQRFIDAMDRYFHTVPDRWEGLSKI